MSHFLLDYDYSDLKKFNAKNLKEIWESNTNQGGYVYEYEPILLNKDLPKDKIDQICKLILDPITTPEENREYSELYEKRWDVYSADKDEFQKLNFRMRQIGKKLSNESRLNLIKSIINDSHVTSFSNNHSLIAEYHNLDTIFDYIKNGKVKSLIEEIRDCSTKDEKKKSKSKLPQILFNGRFHSRDSNCFHSFSDYMCLDFDGFESDINLEEIKGTLIKDEYVIAVFVSPSGNGLKVIIKVEDRLIHTHERYFFGAKEYFDKILEGFDTACKSMTHGCYLSYDPDIRIKDETEANAFNILADIPKPLHKKSTLKLTDLSKKQRSELGYSNVLNNLSILALSDEEDIVKAIFEKWDKNKSNELEEGNTHMPLNNLAFFLWINGINKERIQRLFYKEFIGQADLDKAKLDSKIDGVTNDESKFNSAISVDWEFYHELKNVINDELELPQILSLKGYDINNSEIIREIEILREYLDNHKFWTAKIKIDKEGYSEIIGYSINISQLTDFLKAKGFIRLCQNSLNVYYQNDNNILRQLDSIDDIRNYILNYIREKQADNFLLIEALSRFTYKDQYLSELKVNTIARELDTKTICKKYFLNGVLVIDKLSGNKIMVEYETLENPIFESQIIQHEYDVNSSSEGDFKKFIQNISGNSYNSFKSGIGYLCTNYKSQSNSRAVILNDPGTDFLEANGRRGKSLIGKMLRHVGVIEFIDGKSYKKDNQFVFANISEQTDVIFIDDVRQGLQLTYFYNAITENLQVTKKGKDSFSIPFEISPKLLISSNYPIKGNDGSSKARRFDLVFTNHYSENNTPIDDFGKEFFGNEWTKNDWNSFYTFIIECIQFYMKNDFVHDNNNLMGMKDLYASTSQNFVQFMEEYKDEYTNKFKLTLNEVSTDYHTHCGASISNQKINKWIQIWCKSLKYSYVSKGRKTINGRKETIIEIGKSDIVTSMLDIMKTNMS